jgi:hypothetical protein
MRVHGATGRVKEETSTTEWATSRDEEQQFGAVKKINCEKRKYMHKQKSGYIHERQRKHPTSIPAVS